MKITIEDNGNAIYSGEHKYISFIAPNNDGNMVFFSRGELTFKEQLSLLWTLDGSIDHLIGDDAMLRIFYEAKDKLIDGMQKIDLSEFLKHNGGNE